MREDPTIPNCSRSLSICENAFHVFIYRSKYHRNAFGSRSFEFKNIRFEEWAEWRRRDARLRGGIDHFTRYPTGSYVYRLPYPQLPSDNEAFSRNRVPRNFKTWCKAKWPGNDTSNTVEKTVNICVDPLEEVCKYCLWKLQLSKLQEIYGNRRIYICLELENSRIINNYIFNCYSEQV